MILPFRSLPQYRWLGFELSILRRLKFRSIAIPFAGEPGLELSLKRWGVRVSTNDVFRWAWTKGVAYVQNNSETLDRADLGIILDDAYVPRHRLSNTALANWFSEPDAWWFHNVRENLEKLSSPVKEALALSLGMAVGDYVFSFDSDTREFRLPLSRAFRRFWEIGITPIDNRLQNKCSYQETRIFLAEQDADLLFLRLPDPRIGVRDRRSMATWREEWVRGDDAFWSGLEALETGGLGAPADTKQQYLAALRETLERSTHIPAWAVTHADNGFISTDELVEAVRGVRRVGTIYTKDFSELTGARAAIITTA